MKSFLVYLFSILLFQACISSAQTSTISIEEFEKGIQQKDIQILDVRTSEEYESGHIENAMQANWNNGDEFQERVKSLDKTKPIYIYCLSGGRSNQAMNWLNTNGYTQIYNMKGGITAWRQNNKTIEGAEKIGQISLENYWAQLPKDKTVLVDIGAKWCPPCKRMLPIIEELEKENYTIIKIDGGSQAELCIALHVPTFPTFIVYKNGKEVNRKQGLMTKESLKALLK